MSRPTSNPLPYILARQIDDRIDHCKRLVNARFESSESLFRKDLLSHYGCVNAIEFSKEGDLLVSGGDDRRVLLWRVEQAIQGVGKPAVMKAQHVSNIFCLGYDSGKTKIFSAGNDDQVIVHDLRTGNVLNFFLHEKPVYGLSIHPHNDNVFASACDDGRVLIYDIRDSSAMETFCLARLKTAFHSVMFNPVEPRMLATANAKEGVGMWDVRKPFRPVLRYGGGSAGHSCMNVRFNAAGDRLLALRRRLPPVLYDVDSPVHLCQFNHVGYYNSCTMKSCCFAGDNDEYVLSGSDDFNLYMWKIPDNDLTWVNSAHMVLRGHRSIVNQVRYNRASCVLASSGVEKIIKIWSPFLLGNSVGCLGGLERDAGKQERLRRVFRHDEYVDLVLRSGQFMTHDYSHQSTREDPRMMAFFDSLVQREIEGWSSEDVPTVQQSPSDSENSPTTIRVYSTSDSDDSTASDRQLMLSILGSTLNHRGERSERSSESPPNRITLLIASRREKLMRLATMNGSAPISDSPRADQESKSMSGSSSEAEGAPERGGLRSTSTSTSKPRVVERKRSKTSGRESFARRACTTPRARSDSVVEDAPVDDTQPSTSSGVVSGRSRYVVSPVGSDRRSSFSSSGGGSSSEDNNDRGERERAETDRDAAVRIRGRKRRECEGRSRRDSGRSGGKRPRVDRDAACERTTRCESVNGARTSIGEEGTPSTPLKRTCEVPSTPDSGIASGTSANERNGGPARTARNGAESSDHEQRLRSLECFRRKVDVARRNYRDRSSHRTVSTATDSSD